MDHFGVNSVTSYIHIMTDHSADILRYLKKYNLTLSLLANHGCEALHRELNKGFQNANSHHTSELESNTNNQQLQRQLRLFIYNNDTIKPNSVKSLKYILQDYYIKLYGLKWSEVLYAETLLKSNGELDLYTEENINMFMP